MTKALVMISDFKLSLAARLYPTYQGFEVTLVTSLSAAEITLKEALFDLVMLDLSDRRDFKTSREGLDGFVEKPLTSESLRSGLNRILTKAQSHEKPFLYGGIDLD